MATTTTSTIENPSTPEGLLTTLKTDIELRQIEHGKAVIANSTHLINKVNPAERNAAALLDVLAQWCDIGHGDPAVVTRLLSMYDKEARRGLSLSDYVHIRMAEGMLAMKRDLLDPATEHIEIALKLANEIEAWDVVAIGSYWMARCQRKKGQYDIALAFVRRAREVQLGHGRLQNEAPARVLESLILFERNEYERALTNLHRAEDMLMQSDDYVTLGQIQATYGKILLRELQYEQAIQHFERALELFEKRDPDHLSAASALVDAAFTRTQKARHLRQTIEVSPAHRFAAAMRVSLRRQLIAELSQLHTTILNNLESAANIYSRHRNARGVARVHYCRSFLYLDIGELELAAQEAASTYLSAESKQDLILMASARALQCAVENAFVEEGVDGLANHAMAAQEYARDAVAWATQTQDRRLLAAAHTWHGLTSSNSFFNAQDQAREEMDKAAVYLDRGVHDYLWEDFQLLKKRLSNHFMLEAKLMTWVQDDLDNKTFRQLEENFADMVISKIWDEEQRKVSRVAARLSIAPRKVRRVLLRLGLLLDRGDRDGAVSEKTQYIAGETGLNSSGFGRLKVTRGERDQQARYRPVPVRRNPKRPNGNYRGD